MFERLEMDVRRAALRAANDEALALGSPTVEAEHLLLALAADPSTPAGRLLAQSGLDHGGVLAALDRETERSLAAVGVSLDDFALPRPAAPRGSPRLAASSKRALERAVRLAVARGDRSIGAPHLLAGILRAEAGTVPRALAAAGVDRAGLASGAEALLG
jgi:ATP-dependent Clp protease ATP-binding subunit ClpA